MYTYMCTYEHIPDSTGYVTLCDTVSFKDHFWIALQYSSYVILLEKNLPILPFPLECLTWWHQVLLKQSVPLIWWLTSTFLYLVLWACRLTQPTPLGAVIWQQNPGKNLRCEQLLHEWEMWEEKENILLHSPASCAHLGRSKTHAKCPVHSPCSLQASWGTAGTSLEKLQHVVPIWPSGIPVLCRRFGVDKPSPTQCWQVGQKKK